MKRKAKKFAFIGAASVSGGVLLGLTGGLVAPLIGASIGALLGNLITLRLALNVRLFFYVLGLRICQQVTQ